MCVCVGQKLGAEVGCEWEGTECLSSAHTHVSLSLSLSHHPELQEIVLSCTCVYSWFDLIVYYGASVNLSKKQIV